MRQSKFTETQVVSILKDAMPAATKISMRLPSWRLSRMRDPPAGRSLTQMRVSSTRGGWWINCVVEDVISQGQIEGGAIDGVRR